MNVNLKKYLMTYGNTLGMSTLKSICFSLNNKQ